jgi:hypothetical protein
MENNWFLLRFCSRRMQDGLSWRQRMGNRGSRVDREGHGRWHLAIPGGIPRCLHALAGALR